MHRRSSWRRGLLLPLLLVSSAFVVSAQPDRLSRAISHLRLTTLPGHLHPLAVHRGTDEGPLDAATQIPLMTLALRPTDRQQAELDALLAEQQDPASANYHRWITPDEYGQRFGVSTADLDRIAAWLRGQGFQVEEYPAARNWLAFRGTAAQVNAAFRTELHRYRLNGQPHFAASAEPALPGDLADMVTAITGLHDFALQPRHQRQLLPTPEFTNAGGSANLTPDDLAVIYNLNPLYKAGIDGTGQKIAIAGQTSLNLADIRTFRSRYGLSATDPQVVLYGSDPGVRNADVIEADLDVEWAGAIARNATVVYVYSNDVFTSVQYAIDKSLAPVISFSYGACEQQEPTSAGPYIEQMAKQANAQGITWMAASGDSGAAACDSSSATKATGGLAAGFPASVPEITAVGGTQFNEGSGTYWGANGAHGGSALSYIPEKAWNESGASSGLWASGGGVSVFYGRPTWQTGPGVPSGTKRLVPDVSMAAAIHDGYLVVSGGQTYVVGGTSAASPVFAGVMTLLNQALVAKGAQTKAGLGNVNPQLYNLAQSTTGLFHDTTVGDNAVPCATGALNCVNGKVGYPAAAGYDLATGLGSVDANALVTQWAGQSTFVATVTSVTVDAATVTPTGSVKVTASVKPTSGTGVPAGNLSFTAGTVALGTAALANGSATLSVPATKLVLGANTITATYAGSTGFSGSNGTATVTVAQATVASAVSVAVTPSPVYQSATADASGNQWIFAVKLTETAGGATTLTSFTIDTTDYSATLAKLFGTVTLGAKGTLTANMGLKGLTVPATKVFKIAGKDSSGRVWTQQVSVVFNGLPPAPKVVLLSVPSAMNRSTAAVPATCQWQQELHIMETNGFPVDLSALILGGTDSTKQIASMFGTTKLPAYGNLSAKLCWSSLTAGTAVPYRVEVTDAIGKQTNVTLSTPVQAASTAKSVLTTVPSAPIALQVAAASSRPATATLKIGLTGSSQDWTVLVFTPGLGTPWLTTSTLSGSGSSTLTLTANPVNLAAGVYQGSVVIQALNAVPQWVTVPVTLTVGATTATKTNK